MELSYGDINLFLNLPWTPMSPDEAPGGPLTHMEKRGGELMMASRGIASLFNFFLLFFFLDIWDKMNLSIRLP